MAFMAVLESDLRALSAEARRRYPAVKDGAEHAILKVTLHCSYLSFRINDFELHLVLALCDLRESAALRFDFANRKILRTLSSPSEIAHNEDILRIFLMACEVRTVKLSIIGLSCLQKLISHDAVSPSALREILSTLKDHAEMGDEGVQLKTLQTISIIFQSRLHPENELDLNLYVNTFRLDDFLVGVAIAIRLASRDTMSQALGICLRLLENTRSSDSVRNTAAATFRQAVALIFNRVVLAESLPVGKFGFGGQLTRTTSVTGDVNRSINLTDPLDHESVSGRPPVMRETLTETGKLGLRLLEDLTSLAAGGSANWLRVNIFQRTFALDILEFILSNYVAVFRTLLPYEQVNMSIAIVYAVTGLYLSVPDQHNFCSFMLMDLFIIIQALRRQICSILMTSLRTNAELEGETGEPSFRRLVLRSVAHIIRLYSSSLITECEVFLSMLLKVTFLDLPLWHRILVLEILRGFCVEARTLRILFQNFDFDRGRGFTSIAYARTELLSSEDWSRGVPSCSRKLLSLFGKARGDMDPPVTTLTLFQIEQAILAIENAKLQQEQTLAAFWEHMPPIEEEVLVKRIQELRDRICSLEERRRVLIRERELLLIRAASIIQKWELSYRNGSRGLVPQDSLLLVILIVIPHSGLRQSLMNPSEQERKHACTLYYFQSFRTEGKGFLKTVWCRNADTEIKRGQNTPDEQMLLHPKNTNVVEGMVKALARVVSNVQVQESSEESLAAVAGMFSSKAKGIEWSLDNDASNAAVLVASEAHAITLAVEGLLGVVFTVATLTDEAIDIGELESPRCDNDPPVKSSGKTAVLCVSMVDSLWLTILDALSLILSRSQGEAIVLEVLKGYQAFTQACGILRAVEPLNSFLASLCKFTINFPGETERRSALPSPVSKRSELSFDHRDNVVLTPKNVQALRTLFNIAHRLHNVLGPSWVLVLETLAALDRAIHSPHATTQGFIHHPSDLYFLRSLSDDNIQSESLLKSFLLMLDGTIVLKEAPTKLDLFVCPLTSIVCGFLIVLVHVHVNAVFTLHPSKKEVSTPVPRLTRELSTQFSDFNILSSLNSQLFESSALMNVSALADNSNPHLKNMALDALDQSISAVLGSDRFQDYKQSKSLETSEEMEVNLSKLRSLECSVISPLKVLYFSTQSVDIRVGSLKILLHLLERYGEKLHYSWPNILEMLRYVADVSEKDIVTLGFQNLRVIMNDGLSTLPADCLQVCVDVTGAYSAQKTELNISLTAVGLLWTMTDFIAKGLLIGPFEEKATGVSSIVKQVDNENMEDQTRISNNVRDQASSIGGVDFEKLLFSVFSLLQNLGADERPEVRNSSVRTLFQTLGTHGQKLSKSMWEDCLWNYVFPTLDRAAHMVKLKLLEAATSSKDESQGKELGTRGGKAVHMLIHHSRNTAQKQWDETLVLVFGGIARWESLLQFVDNSILNGSKEVALAAINCLQTTVNSHSSKLVLRKPASYLGNAADKVKQEILHGLGELYVQAQGLFNDIVYTQLIAIIDLAVKQEMLTNDNFEMEFAFFEGNVPPVLRTILEILPLLRPAEHISSMWSVLLREFLRYLPRQDSHLQNEDRKIDQPRGSDLILVMEVKYDAPNGATPISSNEVAASPGSGSTAAITGIPSYIFAEKLVPVLLDLFLQAPAVEKCMTTRRDNPDSALWRLSVEAFNCLLVDYITNITSGAPDSNISKPVRTRIWKEIADVYEIFLIGYCGRALPSNSLSAVVLEADESLEMSILNILGDTILKLPVGTPTDILQRLVSTLDRCASRTCSLPVETVELMPPHCSRFSLTCLQKLFSLSSYSNEVNWNMTRSEVSKISIIMLLTRCEYILSRFLTDENALGDCPLPKARLEEIVYVLQELAHLVIHADAASVLPLHPLLRSGLAEDKEKHNRPHLFVLLPSFCELVTSRELRIRELVQVLLQLVTKELSLEKLSSPSEKNTSR
ncbi:unnamed protein product [Sphenostylis stenocarpa]|uniref:Protein MON2 homolog n=1 Tax=Sphenostylis stenocarpa TaxID=92480 RepID=A0AA86TRL9_9FABA|nr:unnamed protein product [Sphenostylis stenocarpa]